MTNIFTFTSISNAAVNAFNAIESDDKIIADIIAAKTQPAQDVIRRDIKASVIAKRLFNTLTIETLNKALSVLNKATKDRTSLESKAEVAARTTWSRWLAKSGMSSLDGRGAQNKGKKSKTTKAKKIVKVTTKAAFVSQEFKTGMSLENHLNFMALAMVNTVKRSSIHFTKKSKIAAYVALVNDFRKKVKAL